MIIYLICALILSHLPVGRCVSVRLLVPEAVRARTSAILVCQFDLHGQQLYSVKWYRGNFEFFRFIPKERPPAMAFPFPGIDVDVSGSSAHQVSLLNIPAHIGGRFSCEVSAEGPRFTTAFDYADLYVIDIQEIKKPEIHVSSSFYDRKNLERLSINCSTTPTIPPPTIHFYINNVKVFAEWIDIINAGLASLSPKALEPWIEPLDYDENMDDILFNDSLFGKKERAELSDIKPNSDQELEIRCEAMLPQVYHFISETIPLFPQIDEPEDNLGAGASQLNKFRSCFVFSMVILFHFCI